MRPTTSHPRTPPAIDARREDEQAELLLRRLIGAFLEVPPVTAGGRATLAAALAIGGRLATPDLPEVLQLGRQVLAECAPGGAA